ncbi:MAG: hypothetical protein ACUVRR_12510 [Candidatus Fervidibacter sp.]|uniref:hypothetical protein n=1 Tax=Candidatus Fervidibacter sp. TaxID=3100871 RepID=UPI0040499DF1
MERWSLAFACILLALKGTGVTTAAEDLNGKFVDHGVAAPFSTHRGVVATKDGQGSNIVLVWLMDHRGCYELLLIDAETGRSEEFLTPFSWGGDCPYASILSSANRFYSHFGSHFVEFDPVKRVFTFFHKTAPQMAMSMTEGDDGTIWSATYPQCGIVAYNPQTGEFKDFGHVHKENWAQYPRSIAVDDTGWVYLGIGYTSSHILAFNPKTGEVKPMIPESERQQGMAFVFRATNGKVYGQPLQGAKGNWYEFHKGIARKIGDLTSDVRPKPSIAGSQGLFHRTFPDGKLIRSLDLSERFLVVEDPKTGESKKVRFDYMTEGAHIMGVAVAPDNSVCGGTTFPFYFFGYDPKSDRWEQHPCYGQWNTVAKQGDRFFVGGYTGGFLLEWNPFAAWTGTAKDDQKANPRFLTDSAPDIYRPHELLAHPDGRTLVLAGTPAYGYTGGGLLFWDQQTQTKTLLRHTDLLEWHSTMSLVALPNGKLLGGTTTAPGTGGEQKAKQAELYILDMKTKKVEWHEPVFAGVQSYIDLCYDERSGLVYGFADRRRFFVFDHKTKQVIHEQETPPEWGGCISHQGPRVFVVAPDKTIYILFVWGIAKVDPKTFAITLLAKSPVPITAGGDYLDGRIYFASASRLYSFRVLQ